MTDQYDATATMRANRSVDTKPEIAIRSALHQRGLRFRKHAAIDVDGRRIRPDIVFTKAKIAVFVDGCFWHGCPIHGQIPKRNREFWEQKLERNAARDYTQSVALQRAGWKVIRVWEHETPASAVDRVVGYLKRASEPGRGRDRSQP